MKKILSLVLIFILVNQIFPFSLFKFFTTTQPSIGVLQYNNSQKKTTFIGRNLLRLDFITNPLLPIQFDISLDANLLYGDFTKLFITKQNTTKLTDELMFFYETRKCYLKYNTNFADIYIGRQLLKFGEGIIFNPLNPFSKLDFTDIAFARIGVDSVRLKFPISLMSYFETIAISENFKFDNVNFATRILFPVLGYDVSFTGYHYKDTGYTSLGISFKGDLIGGLYGEVVYTSKINKKDEYTVSLMLGFDYSFFENLIIRTEYLNNQNQNLPIYNTITTPFCSSQYIASQIIFTPTMIDSFYLNTIYNLQNNSMLHTFAYQRNIVQNTDVTLKIFYQKNDITGNFQKNFNYIAYLLEFKIKL